MSLRTLRIVTHQVRRVTRRFCESASSSSKQSNQFRGPVTYASLALMAIVGGSALVYFSIEKEKKAERVASEVITTGKPALGGPWVLVDQDGVPRTDASYRGKFCILYFGFTHCPDICPSELVKIGEIYDSIAKKKTQKGGENAPDMQLLFISVDPIRDTIGQLRHYAKDFHENFVYLTGTREQVAAATRAYRVYFSKANENEEDEEDYLVDHSIVLYLLAPNGEFLDFFTQRMKVHEVTDKIMEHAKKWNSEHATDATATAITSNANN